LAYYGVVYNNVTVAKEAIKQISAYREILRDPKTNLWWHILEGSWQDKQLWGTGMGWVACGMVRVYATFEHSFFSAAFASQKQQLKALSNELIEAILPWIVNIFPELPAVIVC
jgi:rhamnogalacturonyl hydrolase YesR